MQLQVPDASQNALYRLQLLEMETSDQILDGKMFWSMQNVILTFHAIFNACYKKHLFIWKI